MKHRLWKVIFNNIGLKILALILAVILWMLARGDNTLLLLNTK
ncbi:MAG: hypothetical protein ABIH39_00790 [Candidatus Margulisiibacteriota bacterium]